MAKLYVYDAYNNKLLKYNLSENDPMPYAYNNTMRVREFRGSSNSPTLWTTTTAMEAWNLTRRRYGKGIYIGYAFKRIWEGGHGTASQHYAGVSFDVGQNTTSSERLKIRDAAVATKAWGYVEPISMTPTWVHFDRRYGKPACPNTTAGYPTVRRGSKSTYVLILQDALNALGYSTRTLDGIFGANTERALKAFQSSVGLTADGICGCNSWKKLTAASVGIGRTSTVID
ncbi:MAG TPA: peptidoglycan-binding protein [Candidatus Ruthenibacterium merdavium]|uniref:Peptidoglycan-binding protein n=1 Tax=Candidatus Ruthenibacterium merdavium TaxID=2838752 RepID=A0A9D2Q4X1_9FIRM|nr:peptidoglycan-binding protein [Candidatus Ruthenibacterium merdavium]